MADKHIGSQESQYMVISIAPDVCLVGIIPVPFDSFQDLSYQKSYVTNVRVRGKPILTVGCEIAGTQSNAGKGISSGTSLGSGDCTIMTGVPHIKCKGKPVARQDSLVAMNNGNTFGKLYTQINPANGEIPVTGTLSLWDMMGEMQLQRAQAEMEAGRQMPDVLEGMGRGFINGWYMLGHMLGKAGMLNGTIEADQQMAVLSTMGINTSSMEAASELNKAVLEETDTSEPLLELENETQEVGANVEAGLELLFLIKGLAQGAIKLIGRGGRSGVKVVAFQNKAILELSGVIRNPDGSILIVISEESKVRKLTPPSDYLGEYGYEYKWKGLSVGTMTVRIHGIDPLAPAGSNAHRGWIVRIFDGKKSMDSRGVYHSPGIFNESSPNYDPSLINDVHIPISTPEKFPGVN